MLQAIILENFKLFKNATKIPLTNINLLTGINGKGKSTVLQSILLFKQSLEYDRSTNRIVFNGSNFSLGSFKDIKNVFRQRIDNIEIAFCYDNFCIKYILCENINDKLVAEVQEIQISGQREEKEFRYKLVKDNGSYKLINEMDKKSFPVTLFDLFLSERSLVEHSEHLGLKLVSENVDFSRIHYVSAERMGPKMFYSAQSLNHFSTVGALGENTINLLHNKMMEPVHANMLKNVQTHFHISEDKLGDDIESLTSFWLGQIFKGAKFQIKALNDNLLTLQISPDGTFDYFIPNNVGYGYSYILPILASGLIAKPGEILIVENPEAHLHPLAQSLLAKFLTFVSLNGVQVIIESHSEHILNGLRIPVYDKIIKKESLNILYFDKTFQEYFTKIIVEDDGGIPDWPANFFDQATKDLNYLFGI